MSKEKIKSIQIEAEAAIENSKTSQELYDQKVKFLGKQGALSLLMREMGKLPKEERPAFGKLVNEAKSQVEAVYQKKEALLNEQEMASQLAKEQLDLSLPGVGARVGSRHPVDIVSKEIVDILARIGYSVRSGPLIEKDRYNFEALNIPADHPARDMQDTFYIDEDHVLRTQTSPIQIHALEREHLPLRILAPGSVFRCDADISHSPNFHQIEGMLVDRKVSMADLKGTISYFVEAFFGKGLKTRFRPSFFPFTEPSAEVDCSCFICKGKGCRMCGHSGWVEIGGCGLVNPKVFENCNIDPKKWQGFAFGFGIERMAIIKYGVSDIRLFSENDSRFLEQFQS
ncbi:MAG: phenylalanine--tRNA ligase subunit alpha [Bdellovibrionales bacterium]|nr:phenylalanine--tRNA ligase subunit alpha [Bdellovibrionales bacterium]